MALRAGYYGIKRQLKAKIADIAAAWDAFVASVEGKVDASAFAPVEDGEHPSGNIGRGAFFIRDGKICICIESMTEASTFTKNTNYIELENYAAYEQPSIENLFTASEGVTLDGSPICARCGNVVYFSLAVNGVDATNEYEVGTFTPTPLETTTLMHITKKASPFEPAGTALVRKATKKLVIPAGTTTTSTDLRIYGVIMFIYPTALVPTTLHSVNRTPEDVPEEVIEEKPVTKKTTRKTVKEGE